MRFQKHAQGYIVRMDVGEEIISTLQTLCMDADIRLAQVRAIGAVEYAVTGLYDVKEQQYHATKLDGPLEIVSLTGNITRKGAEPYIHLHASFADREARLFGGHLTEAVIGATCEMFITEYSGQIQRRVCEKTGLNILNI